MHADALAAALSSPQLPSVGRSETALERNVRGGDELGVELWVKRDDHTDDFGTGSKARKLRYLLADVQRTTATVVVTAASLPSGQASGVAAHAAMCGMRAHVVYCGDEQRRPDVPNGNYLLVALSGAGISWRERSPWDAWPADVAEVVAEERARGERPYILPLGCRTGRAWSAPSSLEPSWPGSSPTTGRPTSSQPPGSGSTALGIAIAGAANRDWTVHGMCISSGPMTRRDLQKIAADSALRFPGLRVSADMVRLHDGAAGGGYARFGAAEFAMMHRGFSRYGLALDPVHMAKTVIGLEQLVAAGVIPAGARTVVVHTGSAISLFNDIPALRDWMSQHLPGYVSGEP